MAHITPEEIRDFAEYIFAISGIHLEQDKGYLLESRLKHLLKSHNCATFAALLRKAKTDFSEIIKKEIIDAISTNETFFFRDNTPFDLLKNKIIPDLIDRRQAQFRSTPIPLRFWSAACSTGQEVYSIAITLQEMFDNPDRFSISMVGTDISNQAVARASYGSFTQYEVERGLPPQLRQKYFNRSGDDWRIKDSIRSLVRFEKFNLMQSFPDWGKFDVVFCRNVAIYFNQGDKIRLFKKIAKVMQPDGALIVGGSENLSGIAPDYASCQYLQGIYYQLKTFSPEKEVAAAAKKKAAPITKRKTKPVNCLFRKTKKSVFAKKSLPVTEEKNLSVEELPTGQQPVPSKEEKPLSLSEDENGLPLEQPLTLTERLTQKQRKTDKKPLLAELQNRQQSDGDSLLAGKETDTGQTKESLLSKLKIKSNKKPES